MIRPLLLAAALTGLTAIALPARAETRTLDSGTLVSNFSLDSDVNIETNSSLHGQIRVTGDDLSCVRFGPGPIVSATGCGEDLGHLRIEVPEHATVTLNQAGDGAVHIGDIGGALIANVTGSGNLTAGNVHTLVLSVRGSGDVTVESAIGSATLTSDSSGTIHVHNVTGPLRSVQNGSGDLAIGAIDSPAADITIDGSGDAVVGKGRIEILHARLNGSGDLTVGATADTADLQASGGGDIKVAHVNHDVHKSASGGSSINVYNSDVAEFGLGKLAQLAATADDDDTSSSAAIHTHRTSHGGSGALHFFAGLAVLFILYAIWRTVQRNGGIGPLQARFNRGPGAPPAPSHPGVIAVRDTITRLEGRLARVENYVTTREFDLQRKFRELDKT